MQAPEQGQDSTQPTADRPEPDGLGSVCKWCGVGKVPPRPAGKCGRAVLYCSKACERLAVLRQRKERYQRYKTEGSPKQGRASAVQPGMRFGKLVVLETKTKFARVECDCGTIKQAIKHNLLAGDTVSCGCLRRDKLRAANEGRLKGEAFLANNNVGNIQPRRPRKATRNGVYAVEPSAEFDDTPVCYVVSTRNRQTEHATFDEARVEYLIRTGRMSA